MGRCEYVDESKSPYDGYYCTITNSKVEYSLTRAYCRYSSDCRYCPVRGGDDRMRNPPEPEKKPEPEPERKRDSWSGYDPYERKPEQKKPNPTPPPSGGHSCSDRINSCLLGVLVACFALGFLVAFLASKTDLFLPKLTFELSVPDGVKASSILVESITHDAGRDYDISSDSLDKSGKGEVKIRDGENSISVAYDKGKLMMYTLTYDGSPEYRNPASYEDISQCLYRAALLELCDGDGNPITTGQLQITDDSGTPQPWVPVGEGRFALILQNADGKLKLHVEVPGYEAMELELDTDERLTGSKLTMKQDR